MRFAVKVLTPSDLGFFAVHFDKENVSGQKSLNLNRSVFIDEFYPQLPALLADKGWAMPVSLQVNGPGVAYLPLQLTRKITKKGSKNWRLNGEVLPNPRDAAERFNELAKDDLALLAFDGAAIPNTVRFFAISRSEPADAALYDALLPSNGRSMVSISSEALAVAIALAPPEHPVHDLFIEADLFQDLEQAAEGDAEATRRLLTRPGSRVVSAEQLAAMRQRNGKIGLQGEQLVNDHFGALADDTITCVWASADNAICPWDFHLTTASGEVRIEVKSTAGAHEASFHVSLAELVTAAEGPRYDIYRLSEVGEETGTLRIAEDVRDFALGILEVLKAFPKGVRPDSLSVSPSLLTWSPPIQIGVPEPDEA